MDAYFARQLLLVKTLLQQVHLGKRDFTQWGVAIPHARIGVGNPFGATA